MIYLVDIGGQPELQEIVPLIVRNASVNLLVLKLSDELKAKPKNEWYHDGECVTEPEEMDITNEEYLENAAKSVFLSKPKLSIKQALSVPDKPSVIVIGTHKDQERECPESLEKKEEALKDKPIFKTHLKENHIKCVRGKIIVDIDGSKAGYDSEENRAKLEKLRHALLTHSSKLKVKVPIAWFLFLLDIQMEADKHDYISLEECYKLGAKLEISTESVDAALQFFDELNLILYFRSPCPNVVFCNPEFLLQKLTDMILTGVSPDVDDQPGSRRIFREQGIFTRELFESTKFMEGFSPMFSLDDFLLLLQHLPIVAKISVDPEKEEYFMPCVLSFKRSSESISVSSPPGKYSVDPLVIIFPKRCSPTGLFCATIVHLIQSHHDELKWIITASENLKRKRNVIEFQICDTKQCKAHYDDKLGTVILEDTSSSFIVHTTVDPVYCHKLYCMLNSALESAIEKLSYSAGRIDYVFGVQCTMCTGKEEGHDAPVGTGSTWRCDKKYKNKPLTPRQRPWFEEHMEVKESECEDTNILPALSLDGQPKMHELQQLSIKKGETIKIIESIAPHWEKVAYGLKLPKARIEIIQRDYKDRCESACQEMLQRWLDGIEGTSNCTWKSMIMVLKESNNSDLALSLISAIN